MTITTYRAHVWWQDYASTGALFRRVIDQLCRTPFDGHDEEGNPLPNKELLHAALDNLRSTWQARELRVFRDLLKTAGLWPQYCVRRRTCRSAAYMCRLAMSYGARHGAA